MKKVICKLVSSVMVAAISLTTFPSYAMEAMPSVDKEVESFELLPGFEVSTEDVMPLNDGGNDLFAFYLHGTDGGYAIVDTQGNIIEYSEENDEELDESKIWYYISPTELGYADECDDEEVVSLDTEECISLDEIQDYESCEESQISIQSAVPESVTITYPGGYKDSEGNTTHEIECPIVKLAKNKNIRNKTRCFNYNYDGTCGSTACAILIYYYYDYISKSYIKDDLYKDTSVNSQRYLVEHFWELNEESGDGTSASDLVCGLNAYLKEVGKKQTAALQGRKSINTYMKKIDSGKPCLVLLNDEPAYDDHWVVGEGYANYRGTIERQVKEYYFLRVNNGYGYKREKSIVYVNYDYLTAIVYLN